MIPDMTPSTVALVLLTAQRHHLEGHPDEARVSQGWQRRVLSARAAGHLIVHVQWDGAAGTPNETFSRGWVLHPDFRAEAGDLPLRATLPDAFAGTGLDAELRRRAVREVELLALPGADVLPATLEAARALGYEVRVLEVKEQPSPV